MQDKSFWNDWTMVIMASLTLGLAPFVPEPHIWGKLKWIAGGAEGMSLMDWGDFFMHGIPWMLLIRLIVIKSWASIKPVATQK